MSFDRTARLALASALCDFHKCPYTERVIDSPKHDDKVLCGCRKTNPRVHAVGHSEAVSASSVHHIKRYLNTATAEEFEKQMESDKLAMIARAREFESNLRESADIVDRTREVCGTDRNQKCSRCGAPMHIPWPTDVQVSPKNSRQIADAIAGLCSEIDQLRKNGESK